MARINAQEPPPWPGARWVALTQGKFALVDEADFERVNAVPWKYNRATGRAVRGKQTTVQMSRFIVGAAEDVDVDHINGDRLDNRRTNLRVATHQQNLCNRPVHAQNASGFKGVGPWTHSGKYRAPVWRARIKVNGKRISIGTYPTAEAAARAYDDAARLHHGEFARLNFPLPGEQGARPNVKVSLEG